MTQDLAFKKEQNLGIITLSRPAALNALTFSMIKTLRKQLSAWAEDKDIHAVIMQAEPGKAFCAGGDIRHLYESGLTNPVDPLPFFRDEYQLNLAIHEFPKPYIALMDGITMGGGVGISLHGSHPVAGERFVFAMPETAIGFFPDIGASYLLSRLVEPIGLYLALTGNRLKAEEALSLGLVKHCVAPENWPLIVPYLLESDLSTHAHARVTELLSKMQTKAHNDGMRDAEIIGDFFNEKSLNAIFTKLEQSDDTWAKDTLANLRQRSPLSLEVTFEQIKRAKTTTLAECLYMDYTLVQHFLRGKDFYEGVRAAIIDKDKNPKWQPDSIGKVSEAMVTAYFDGLQSDKDQDEI